MLVRGIANRSLDQVADALSTHGVKFATYPKLAAVTLVVGVDQLLLAVKKRPTAKFIVVDTLSALIGVGIPIAGMARLHGGTYVTASPVWQSLSKFLHSDSEDISLRVAIPFREFLALSERKRKEA